MSLMPTWLIGICRVSARFCTSSTETTRAWGAGTEFMDGPGYLESRTVCGLSAGDQPLNGDKAPQLSIRWPVSGSRASLFAGERTPPAFHRGREAALVEFGLHQAVFPRTVFDEAIRNTERERGQQ